MRRRVPCPEPEKPWHGRYVKTGNLSPYQELF
jgi:hypothetical protein